MMGLRKCRAPNGRAIRWLRIAAIAVSSIILASCRAVTVPPIPSLAVLFESSSVDAPLSDHTVAQLDPEVQPSGHVHPSEEIQASIPDQQSRQPDGRQIQQAGLEVPCPPLPRLAKHPCLGGSCGSRQQCAQVRQSGACGTVACSPVACIPGAAVPMVGPYVVCDGGDAYAPARPAGRFGIQNVTAGDTVARYRPVSIGSTESDPNERQHADEHDAEGVCLTVSNCACVYAPRFASVREVSRPSEEASPIGPKGLTLDTLAGAQVKRQPVWGSTQRIALVAARRAEPSLAVEERMPALAVDQNNVPSESDGVEGPAARVADDQPMVAERVDRPRIHVGFDVPFAWTCVTGAQVMVMGQAAEVIAADRGTATLRLEEPGRCELTLCKRAGSDTARVGEELDFTIFLLNSGDRPLQDVVLVDAIPTRLQLIPKSVVSNLPADISTATGDDGSVVLTWRLQKTLQPGEGGFVRFRTVVH